MRQISKRKHLFSQCEKKTTFREVKNKLNDNRADTKQYEHEAPANFVLKMYKK